MVNLNHGPLVALGRSIVADPRAGVRVAAGSAAQLPSHVLDLDAVTRVRGFGTGGVSPGMWTQLDEGAAASLEAADVRRRQVRPRNAA